MSIAKEIQFQLEAALGVEPEKKNAALSVLHDFFIRERKWREFSLLFRWGRRCYTHLPPGDLVLGVIPTGFGCFSFFFWFLFMLLAVKRKARARSISHTSTHIFTAAVSARGGTAAGRMRRSQNAAEKLQACSEARAAVSLIGLLAV